MSRQEYNPARHSALLATIRNLKARQLEIDHQITLFIKAGIREGLTWREVGDAVGTSGQAAWEKYRTNKPPEIMRGLEQLPIE